MRKSILLATVAAFVVSPVFAQTGETGTTDQPVEQRGQVSAGQEEAPGFDQVMAAEELTDEDFVTVAGMSDLFEIEAARIAVERTESDQVRQFAERLLDDHRRAGQDLAAAAQDADVQVAVVNRLEIEMASDIEATGTGDGSAREAPATGAVDPAQSVDRERDKTAGADGAEPPEDTPAETGEAGGMMEPSADIGRSSMLDPEHETVLEDLRQASGEEFDRRFLDAQVEAHERAISLFERYVAEGESDSLRQHAEATLPDLESHLEEANSLRDEAG